MKKDEVLTTTCSAIPSGTVSAIPYVTYGEGLQEGNSVIVITDGTYEKCPHCGSLIFKATVEQK